MKPLKTGAAGTRRARTLAIAGISAVALLAPFVTATAASAASTVGIAVTGAVATDAFPSETLNDGTASTGNWTVKTTGDAYDLGTTRMVTSAGATITPAVNVPNVAKATVTISGAGIAAAIVNGVTFEVDAGVGTVFGSAGAAWTASGDTLTASVVKPSNMTWANVDPALVLNENLSVTVTGNYVGNLSIQVNLSAVQEPLTNLDNTGAPDAVTPGTNRTPTPGGTVKNIASASFSTSVAKPLADAAGEFVKQVVDDELPYAGLYTDYEFSTVKKAGASAKKAGAVTVTAIGAGVTSQVSADGVTTITTDNGNKFFLNEATGVISAKASDIKALDLAADVTVTLTLSATPAVVEVVTLKVGFNDHSRIAPAFVDSVYTLAGAEIIQGNADGTFKPTAPVSRQAFAAFLFRTAGEPTGYDCNPTTDTGFSDVAWNHPFCTEIAWLADTGITTGYEDGTFKASEPITRRAMVTMIYRYDQLNKGFNSASPSWNASAPASAPFTDVAVGSPFAGEIKWAADEGITNGWDDGTFRPGNSTSRQATAVFLDRL